jgi:hypothetical protein
MWNSFVALIDCYGLESLLPESKATSGWMWEMAQRRRAACHWVVMERQVADEIVYLLLAGDSVSALHQLAASAKCMGPLQEPTEVGRSLSTP